MLISFDMFSDVSKKNYFIFSIFILFILFWKLTLQVQDWYYFYHYPFSIEYGEPFILNAIHRFQQGLPLYEAQPSDPQALTTFYPPLYYWIYSWLEPHRSSGFAAGRLISMICAFISCFLVYQIILQENQNKRIGFICALLFFVSPVTQSYGAYAMGDFLGLSLTLLGFYLTLHFKNSKIIFISLPFFILAFLTRHSLVAAPIAIILNLLFSKRSHGMLYAILYFSSVGIILYLGNFITQGGFLEVLVGLQKNMPFDWSSLGLLYLTRAKGYLFMILLALFSCLHEIKNRKVNILNLYFLFALLTSLGMAKRGSDVNYLIEIMAITSIYFGKILLQIQNFSSAKKIMSFIFILSAIAFPLPQSKTKTFEKDYSLKQKIVSKLIQEKEPILMEIPDVIALYSLPQKSYEIFMSRTSRPEFYNEILTYIQKQQFKFLVLESKAFSQQHYQDEEKKWGGHYGSFMSRFSLEMVQAIEKNYQSVPELSGEHLFFLERKMSSPQL
ncbi:MAG: glycosyltransferase family 39 protein [Deltaproteobacteria bacterium]|nr:glycosyltransferase family 39 protein [Deltaproteobacteria bacterium]